VRGDRAHGLTARLAALAARASRRALALARARALGLALTIASEADVGARPRTWEMWWRCRGDMVEMWWRCSGDIAEM